MLVLASFTATYSHGTAEGRTKPRGRVDMAHHRGRPGGDAKGHCMFTHVTHVGQTIVICCRSLWVVMASCKEEFSQDTQDRCATLGRLIPQVCLIRYGIPRFLGIMRVKSYRSIASVFCIYYVMICSWYLSACLFFLHLPIRNLYLQPVEARRHWGLSHTWVYL